MYIHIVGKGIYSMDKLVIGQDKSGFTLKLWCRNINVLLVERLISKDIANEILESIFDAMDKTLMKGSRYVSFDEGAWFAKRVEKMSASNAITKRKTVCL